MLRMCVCLCVCNAYAYAYIHTHIHTYTCLSARHKTQQSQPNYLKHTRYNKHCYGHILACACLDFCSAICMATPWTCPSRGTSIARCLCILRVCVFVYICVYEHVQHVLIPVVSSLWQHPGHAPPVAHPSHDACICVCVCMCVCICVYVFVYTCLCMSMYSMS